MHVHSVSWRIKKNIETSQTRLFFPITMTNKEQYLSFCQQHPEIPLFQQAWWMQCVAGHKEWDVLLIRNEQNEIIAFLPYLIVRKYGFRMVLQPLLSQCNGLWTRSDVATDKEISNKIISEVEKLNLHWFMQYFPSSTLLDPWIDKGYKISHRHTYVIESIQQSPETIFQRFSSAQKRQIKKAERNGIVVKEGHCAADFYQFHTSCLKQRGEKNLNLPDVEVTLCEEAMKREKGALLYAIDHIGKTLAALFLAWDSTTAYYMIPVYDNEEKSSGASSLLVWHGILLAQQKGLSRFDFEGSMQPSIAQYYKQFGSTETEYHQIEKINHPLIKLWKKIR